MADNTQLNAATSVGDIFASDDIAGVKFPRSKLIHGTDGTNDGDVHTGNPLPTEPPRCTTSACSNVNYSSTSQTALTATTARKGLAFYNDADKPCYVKFGVTASTTSFTKRLAPGEYWEPARNYTGRVDVIWDAGGAGALRVTELTL